MFAWFAFFWGGVILLPFDVMLEGLQPQVENHCSRLKASPRVCAVPLNHVVLSLHIQTMELGVPTAPVKISTGPVPALTDKGHQG